MQFRRLERSEGKVYVQQRGLKTWLSIRVHFLNWPMRKDARLKTPIPPQSFMTLSGKLCRAIYAAMHFQVIKLHKCNSMA